ncbi:glucose-specific PTS transporter subunit IIBC [Salisediminibacterium selenitireducens]|uniref:PTS system, glucose-specific IIBC subunit n=1 Tax=Bacillus selenitireducens (strain ATCC 700615 / DSM 15326 / MLS10) TaxID=439292 RepID=D6Y0Y8_BACIE|nr:glucose-specific PTS transporter subunit IIBC [Salisediminibacterium selenitireducens]ADH98592.1 PTS system, glucose-specific IIBC subunit [[Bacillus] selenitireducens MLS10]
MKNAFGILQKVGRSLMLPVALLPAAGILLAFGDAMQNPDMIARFAFLDSEIIALIAEMMQASGDIVFGNLPLLFAVGVAIGLSDGDGVAGLAAIIGYLIMNVTMSVIGGIDASALEGSPDLANVLGIPTLQTGVFGGIIAGLLGAYMYNRFFNIELPSYLGFFAGKRFVPIVTAASAILLGVAMHMLWPFAQDGLNSLAYFMTEANRTLSTFIFGVVERALIPFGLHHIFYSPFWFEFGSYTNAAGEIIRGDQQIFFNQIRDGAEVTAGAYMTGKFPFMMFGLPAAALAIYHCARPENKKVVAGIMSSAALTSFLTGITEPIEFSFLFVAPLLFAIHTIFAGLSFMTMHLLDVQIGMTFSGGVIDFFLYGILPGRTEWWLVIPVGLVFAVIYYFGFRFAITKFNLMTPGREEANGDASAKKSSGNTELPYEVLKAMGGKDNITYLDACITRLRMAVHDTEQVDKERLKQLGASGVMTIDKNIQAIFGPRSETIKGQMRDIINGKAPEAYEDPNAAVAPSQVASTIDLAMPLEGELIDLANVPDNMFAEKMMGDGFAIEPSDGLVVSPVNGEVVNLFPTMHAIGLLADDGTEVLVHIGVDTVNMKGDGFEAFVSQGDRVAVGDELIRFDLELVKQKAKAATTPVIFTNLAEDKTVSINEHGSVKRNETGRITIN